MKYVPFLTASLLLGGSALANICLAQDEDPVIVEKARAQSAKSEKEAQKAEKEAQKAEKNADEAQRTEEINSRVSAQVKAAMEQAQTQIERAQGALPAITYYSQYTPEMAKKTRDITVLRQMLALKLTARDLERAIPLLKQLRDTDKAVPEKPDQALDEEYHALLLAKPGDPLPPSSAEALRDASKMHREQKQAVWDSMQKAIGKDKTAGIRQMLRSESYSGFNVFGATTPLRVWSSGNGFTFTTPEGRVERRVTPLAPVPSPPPGAVIVPPAPEVPTLPDDKAPPVRRRSRNQDTTSPDAVAPVRPGAAARQGNSALDMSRRMNNLFTFNSGQVSLDELIDLMEKKLAAMR